MWVTDSRMLCSLPRSCLVHPVDRFDSEGWFSSDQMIFLTVSCFVVKKHAAFKWKDAISAFPVSPGSAEALVRWDGKIKYILIAYFLGNIRAKNYSKSKVWRFIWHNVIMPSLTTAFKWAEAIKTSHFPHQKRKRISVGRYGCVKRFGRFEKKWFFACNSVFWWILSGIFARAVGS